MSAAQLLASKLLSLIRYIHGRLRAKMKRREGDSKAITEAIHEYKYEKLNDSSETEEKKIGDVEKRKLEPTREQTDRDIKYRKLSCN